MALHDLDYYQNGDMKRNYHGSIVEYQSKNYYVLSKDNSTVELTPLRPDGMFAGDLTVLDMNDRPELKIPKLGYFLHPNIPGVLVAIHRSVRRQWMFGACQNNVTSYVVGLNRQGTAVFTKKNGISQYLYDVHLCRQMLDRNKTLDQWQGEAVFVLSHDFAVINKRLLHTDGVIGTLDIVHKRVKITNNDLDDSIMRDQIEAKLGWRAYAQ